MSNLGIALATNVAGRLTIQRIPLHRGSAHRGNAPVKQVCHTSPIIIDKRCSCSSMSDNRARAFGIDNSRLWWTRCRCITGIRERSRGSRGR
eukprot:3993730-Pyramimonas_sp.AAC.1